MATILETPSLSTNSTHTAASCILVIFGGTGDLTKRKLIPALYNLACAHCMGPQFEIIAMGRSKFTDDEFREAMKKAAASSKDARDFTSEGWEPFGKKITYLQGDSKDPETFQRLAKRLEEMRKNGSSPNTLFYLSIAASLAPPIIDGLAAAGLSSQEKGWTRIILEKPFGRDLTSAKELNAHVEKVFEEKDVYRIDHYLGKETVQNIIVFRFGNSLFEPVWNRNYIQYVEITAAEPLGVEDRAAFYEETGALRDMVANHLLQLLTLTAMEPPVAFDADAVREQKVQVLRSIRPMTKEEVSRYTVRGQYGPGTVGDKSVPGYREEKNVNPQSRIETYSAVQFFINNWRWAGVPFYLRAGKRLAVHRTEVIVHFKRTPQAIFSLTPDNQLEHNKIQIRIQPNEGISLNFGAKHPGNEMRTANVNMNFSYKEAFGARSPVAYETLLLDAMQGDPTLFTRRDEVEAEWRLITPIEEGWEASSPSFPNYASGSQGPEEANRLLAANGHTWSNLSE